MSAQILQQFMEEKIEPVRAFDDAEYARRRDRLRSAMADTGLDLVLLASPESQCWLHGYQARWYRTGSSTAWPPLSFTAVHVDHDRLIVFDSSDHARLIQFTSVATDLRHPNESDPDLVTAHRFVRHELAAEGWLAGRCGIELWSPRHSYAPTRHLLETLADQVVVTDATILVRGLQRVKSEAELAVIRQASGILDAAYAHLLDGGLRPELTELQVNALLEGEMARLGGESAGLHNTASRTRSYCHAFSSTRTLGRGQLLIDPCGVKHRYHANTARQFFLGEPPAELVGASQIAAGARNVLREVATVGTSFATVSARLREYYRQSGLWELRDWLGGYQLGIAFPPDWVGEFTWDVELDEPEKIVEHGLVTNFESFIGGAGCIDTIAFLHNGVEILSNLPALITVIDPS